MVYLEKKTLEQGALGALGTCTPSRFCYKQRSALFIFREKVPPKRRAPKFEMRPKLLFEKSKTCSIAGSVSLSNSHKTGFLSDMKIINLREDTPY